MSEVFEPQSPPKAGTRGDIPRSHKALWTQLHFYTKFVWRFVALQRPEPLIYGIALTDRCNLACRGCHVSNTGRPDKRHVSVPSNNPAPTNLEVLWHELEHQKKLTTDLASQVQRVRRFARVDELEAVTGKLEQESILIRSVTELSRAVRVLADVRQRELSVDEMGQIYHRQKKQWREREIARKLAHYRHNVNLQAGDHG